VHRRLLRRLQQLDLVFVLQANKRLCFDRVVKWESARKRDGCNSKHDSGADHAVEDLLHNVMDRCVIRT
jgi:hypothetical protein